MRRAGLIVFTLHALACGQQAPKPAVTPVTPGPDAVAVTPDVATQVAAETAAPTAQADAASARAPTAQADAASAQADATAPDAPAPPDTAAPETVSQAPDASAPEKLVDVAVAETGSVTTPSELPRVPGMDPAVVARILSRQPGCVGMSSNGRYVLSYVVGKGWDADKDKPELRLAEASGSGLDWVEESTLPGAIDEALADPELLDAARGGMGPCQTVVADDKEALVIPKAVPIHARSEPGYQSLEVGIDGNQEVHLEELETDCEWKLASAYWSADSGRVFLRVLRSEVTWQPMRNTSTRSVGDPEPRLASVAPTALGASGCLPRPLGNPPLAPKAPPPFTASPGHVDCVAMTADGSMAAFKTFRLEHYHGMKSEPNAIAWFGAKDAKAPDIDLACMARARCTKEQKTALEARAAALGLTGCAVAGNAMALDGQAVPLRRAGGELRLKGGSGWRGIYTLTNGLDFGTTEEPIHVTETIWKLVQHPAGGPLFIYSGLESDASSRTAVIRIDVGDLGLCDSAPPGTLAVAGADASSSEKGASVALGPAQLIDNDLTTAWQGDSKKASGGQWVSVSLAQEAAVSAIEIANGWQRQDGYGDYFDMNARVARATLSFDDGESEAVTFAPDERGFVHLALGKPHRTRSVKLTIEALHDGARWPKDVSLSEVRLLAAAP